MPKAFRYSVFLNFRGETRYGFTGHLHKSLIERGFCTFFDESGIEKGTRIRVKIPEAIEESKIFIVVLSKDYASSSFCLNELVQILEEFEKGGGRWVFPIFYYVDKSDVKYQTGSYGEALASLENSVEPEKFKKWTNALTSIADFHGYHIHMERKYEYLCIDDIIEEVSLHLARPIGLVGRVDKVMCCLNSGSDDDRVCVVGICGVPGIGKRTLARRVYHFHDSVEFYPCFLNVGEYLKKHGSGHLRQKLVSDIFGQCNSTSFPSVDEEMSPTIKHMLSQKKVFLILEDVHDSEGLKAIVKLINFLGSGSKVVITSGEKCFLQTEGITEIYEVERMDKYEALQLLNFKLFCSKTSNTCYMTILKGLETYGSGNPFILEVIGSHLSGKSIKECESALHRYKQIPNGDIKKILQVSFDALEKLQQNMLIHIALHLNEQKLAIVEKSLHSKYGKCSEDHTRALLKTCLIKINEDGRVILHNLTQGMVRDNTPLEDLGQNDTVV